MSDYYILNGHDVVPVNDGIAWGRWLQSNDRRVGKDVIDNHLISTVFLGLDHNFIDGEPPLLFETMVFDSPRIDGSECYCERCSTWEQAEAQHAKACEWVRNGKPE